MPAGPDERRDDRRPACGRSPTPPTFTRSSAADGRALEHFADLEQALAQPAAGDWRIHFHVPLFTAEYDGLGSTQDDVRRVIEAASRHGVTRHLEIETYTWDVLPARLKIDLLESIAREYDWVLECLPAKRSS